MRYLRPIIVLLQVLFLLSWLAVGCAPAPSTGTDKAPAGRPSATVSQAKQRLGRTPSPTRSYDVPLPPATATVKAPQSPVPAATTDSSAGGVRLTILHTNDSRGYVDPCGWGVPKGGVARRATKIKAIRNESQHPVLVLDAGDTLFGQMLALQSEGQVIVEAMNAMGYDAMAVGQMDLAKGVDTLLARAKEARFPILSCNLVGAQDQKPIFQPYTILERGGVRFALLGVTEPAALEAPGVREVAQVLDPVNSVKKHLGEIKGQSDMLIVLSHLGVEGDRALAQAVPEIDLIIGGKSRRLMSVPDVVGSTFITQMGYDGEWLGRLDVTLDAQGQVRDPQGAIIELGPDVVEDVDLKALVDSYKEQFPQPTTEPTK